ncbi:MAG: hypothetical protein LBD36_01515 [Holosporales bacterium]|jgi:hypothetical protein|nr:hypothetical protein [Holosporales bacterium]
MQCGFVRVFRQVFVIGFCSTSFATFVSGASDASEVTAQDELAAAFKRDVRMFEGTHTTAMRAIKKACKSLDMLGYLILGVYPLSYDDSFVQHASFMLPVDSLAQLTSFVIDFTDSARMAFDSYRVAESLYDRINTLYKGLSTAEHPPLNSSEAYSAAYLELMRALHDVGRQKDQGFADDDPRADDLYCIKQYGEVPPDTTLDSVVVPTASVARLYKAKRTLGRQIVEDDFCKMYLKLERWSDTLEDDE